MKSAMLVVVTCLCVAGCGASEPSESEMIDAFAKAASMVAGPQALKQNPEMALRKKVACHKQDDAYRCEFETGVGPGQGRFVKSEDGWHFFPVQ